MAPERQGRRLDAAGQPPLRQVAMEPSQAVDVDRVLVDPHALQQVGGAGRSLAQEHRLVEQVEYVAHCRGVLSSSLAYAARSAAGAGPGQPIEAVSEKSLRTVEMSCRRRLFELGRPG